MSALIVMTSKREPPVIRRVPFRAEEARRKKSCTNLKCEVRGSIFPAVEQRKRLHGVVSQESEMSNGRRNLLFFGLIAASLCAAAVLTALLAADDIAGPRVAMNHSPPHSEAGSRQ